MQFSSANANIFSKKFRIFFCPWKHLPSKVAYLWQFGFLLPLQPWLPRTAQNYKFILEMWLKIPLSTTQCLTPSLLCHKFFYSLRKCSVHILRSPCFNPPLSPRQYSIIPPRSALMATSNLAFYNEFITCFHESWIYETWTFSIY